MPHRLETAIGAVVPLQQRPRVAGWQVSKVLGYVTPVSPLARSMFSLPDALYQCVRENWSRKGAALAIGGARVQVGISPAAARVG